ncbi:MAG TPA: recombinase family protein [Bacillota bacterium]|nr:recombinase family protein [Bacillota bacterium]
MADKESLRAALYIRVSTEEQALDGQSADAQAETLKQYCIAFGISIYDYYMDLGVSGKSMKDRHELKRLIEDCKSRFFDIVLVWKISRLSRNLKDLLYLIDIFENNGVCFASCSEKFDTSTPIGRMTLQLLGSVAEFERNTIVQNVKLGLKEFARKGGKSSTVLGYDNIDKKLVVNEEEAGIVRLIFRLYAEGGMNCSAIAGYLNSMGLKTKRGCEFRGSSISYILHNTVYIGINRHLIGKENQYSVKGAHDSIIDDELWNKAQKASTGVRKRTSRKASDYSGMQLKAFCMKCGMPLTNFHASSKGKKYIYLRCRNCSNYVNAEKLTKAVLEAIEPITGKKEPSMHRQLPELPIKRIEAYKGDVNVVLKL